MFSLFLLLHFRFRVRAHVNDDLTRRFSEITSWAWGQAYRCGWSTAVPAEMSPSTLKTPRHGRDQPDRSSAADRLYPSRYDDYSVNRARAV
ncbi:uncharacterized protein B0H18DRAFT_82609 [Fomitopsis serialis]|uniref:uncharacterized protein n=1 Tax=Fomitopsis serialis TaxID=139415 RepID=UPI0020088067|nr:uncharacterized protein B0H18DRAFT_82609 [Neoantrodia serialis]KAH9915843.1 hypothetical protein B0H18DRAFT_82609 [Neoantrodia serialis]